MIMVNLALIVIGLIGVVASYPMPWTGWPYGNFPYGYYRYPGYNMGYPGYYGYPARHNYAHSRMIFYGQYKGKISISDYTG